MRIGRFFVGGVQHQSRDEVVVPAGHEGEDGLHSQSRLHDGQHDLIKGIELACTVNAGGLHDLHGKGGVQILLHEEKHGGCCNAGNDQGDEAVFQAHLGGQLQKAQCGHLCGHGHDEQGQGKGGLFELEVIGINAVSRQRREVDAERCRAGRHQQAVADAAYHRDVGVRKHVAEVCDDGLARHQREALLNFEVGAGGVDDQHIEEEQAQKADQHQHQIEPRTAGGYSFYRDARMRRLTRYRYNNSPLDMDGHRIYIKDGHEYAQLCDHLNLTEEAAAARKSIDAVEQATLTAGWDGAWFRRAYDAFGKPIGSKECTEGQIFIEPQGMCVMAGIGKESGQAAQALASVEERLDTKYGVVLLQPAYTSYQLNLGEISSYPPGYKENAAGVQHGIKNVTVDGKAIFGNVLPLAAAGTEVTVQVTMG